MTATIIPDLPVFVVIAPLFVAFVLPTFARRMRLVEALVILVGILGFLGALYLASLVFAQKGSPLIYSLGGWQAPWGIELKAGNLGALFLLVVTGVSLPVSLFAKGNLAQEVGGKERSARFYVLYLLLGGALAGMAVTNDLFNVFVLVEVVTLSCCGLVSARNHPRAAEAAFKYLIMATLGSTLVMGGVGFIYMITGHLNMEFAARELASIWQHSPHVVWMALSFILVGFGVKAAVFPLHVWLPDAHSTAPSPASAILSGLAVKGYLICLLKFLYNVFGSALMQEFAVDRILVLAGAVAIIAGSILALSQDELKRRLAYSTVAQVGYIVLGLGLLNKQGLAGTLFYLASHAVIKSTLFLAAGAIIAATGKKKVSELSGIGRKMPLTMAAFTIGSFGLIGLPLFSGFVGKWYLLLGSIETGKLLPTVVVIAGSILCATYLLPVIRRAYFEPAPDTTNADWQDPQDPGFSQKLALILLAAIVVLLGVVPGPLLELAKRAAVELLLLQ
ncbi:MAG TPA: monovalent cation/H+ antiporter subunit D family protein [Firmicutes bacterium]|jgi:multicomponent Na+:H+ antiporter subunit D|nr:monovalent cation/H+ antiporter subunit D family protein [Bacillota bacterium]HCT37610.1 monovalent cation/H+ antiporter subunit D family protein [Bacillota bacterium]